MREDIRQMKTKQVCVFWSAWVHFPDLCLSYIYLVFCRTWISVNICICWGDFQTVSKWAQWRAFRCKRACQIALQCLLDNPKRCRLTVNVEPGLNSLRIQIQQLCHCLRSLHISLLIWSHKRCIIPKRSPNQRIYPLNWQHSLQQ